MSYLKITQVAITASIAGNLSLVLWGTPLRDALELSIWSIFPAFIALLSFKLLSNAFAIKGRLGLILSFVLSFAIFGGVGSLMIEELNGSSASFTNPRRPSGAALSNFIGGIFGGYIFTYFNPQVKNSE